MKFDKNEVKVTSLIPPIESNQILINVSIKDDVKLQILVDSTTKEIWIDRHEDSDKIFKDYTLNDGRIGF